MSVIPDDQPGPAQGSPRRSAWRRAWPLVRVAAGLVAVGIAAWVISGQTDELTSIGSYLDHLEWWWLVVAALAEAGSYTALSSLQRRLLWAGRVRVQPGTMLGITLASNAIQYSFPGGGIIYLAYLFRQFRHRGAEDILSGWVILAFNIVSFTALALISAAGLALAFGSGSTFGLVGVLLGIFALAALLALLVNQRRRLVPHLTRSVALSQRVVRWPRRDRPAAEVVAGWTSELAAVSPSRKTWVRSAVMGLSNWLADMACLALCFYAVGAGIPWRGLLLAYGAGQLASTLPITPGGLGAVEGSLYVALVNFGGAAEATVAAVLLYRMLSFWLVLPVGWACWARLTWVGRRARRHPERDGPRSVSVARSGTRPAVTLPGSGANG